MIVKSQLQGISMKSISKSQQILRTPNIALSMIGTVSLQYNVQYVDDTTFVLFEFYVGL